MPKWQPILISDAGFIADELQRVAGKDTVEKIRSKFYKRFPEKRITIGGVTKGFSKKDLDNSQSYLEFMVRRARGRDPINNHSKFAQGRMFVSIGAGVNKTITLEIDDGKISDYKSEEEGKYFGGMKHNGLSLFRDEGQGGLSPRRLRESLQKLIEGYVEHPWHSKTSMVRDRDWIMPELKSSDFAKGDYAVISKPESGPESSELSDLAECLCNLHNEIMKKEPKIWGVSTSILLDVNESLVTSNHHTEPARKAVSRCLIDSDLRFKLKDDVLVQGVSFHRVGTIGSFRDITKHLDKGGEEKFVQSAIDSLKERKKLKPVGNYGNRLVQAILFPTAAGIYAHEVCHGAEADHPMIDFDEIIDSWEIGKRIYTNLTILDDPTNLNLFGFVPFDELGIISKQKNLIVDGVQVDRLYHFDASGLLGKPVDGHMFKEQVRMTNTVVKPSKNGPRSIDEIIEEAQNVQGELPLLVFPDAIWGYHDSQSDTKGIGTDVIYLIPYRGKWEDRVPLGYPNNPIKVSKLKFYKEGLEIIDPIVGSQIDGGGVCTPGYCGKGSGYIKNYKEVGFLAPMLSMKTAFHIMGSKNDSKGRSPNTSRSPLLPWNL